VLYLCKNCRTANKFAISDLLLLGAYRNGVRGDCGPAVGSAGGVEIRLVDHLAVRLVQLWAAGVVRCRRLTLSSEEKVPESSSVLHTSHQCYFESVRSHKHTCEHSVVEMTHVYDDSYTHRHS